MIIIEDYSRYCVSEDFNAKRFAQEAKKAEAQRRKEQQQAEELDKFMTEFGRIIAKDLADPDRRLQPVEGLVLGNPALYKYRDFAKWGVKGDWRLCLSCGEWMRTKDFYRNRRAPGGWTRYCRKCFWKHYGKKDKQ